MFRLIYRWFVEGEAHVRCYLPADKLVEDTGERTLGNPDRQDAEHQSDSAIVPRVIRICDAAGDQAAGNARVIRLPAPVIALGNNRIGLPVQQPRCWG